MYFFLLNYDIILIMNLVFFSLLSLALFISLFFFIDHHYAKDRYKSFNVYFNDACHDKRQTLHQSKKKKKKKKKKQVSVYPVVVILNRFE
jgi:hypothetical protein